MPGLSLVSTRYRVESLIGGGGCGVVYRARRDGMPVAIKVLRPELVRSSSQSLRFFREARLAATLHHDNIVDITDFGNDESSGAPYLVMELLGGRTLAAELREHGALPWKRVASLLHQIARALVCAHGQGVIHRDLAPHNIMLEGEPAVRVKVCDFGLSRLRNGDSFVGTPAYMAPEQIRDGDQDERCDLYALGVLGFEMLTGTLPYRASSPVALVSEILGGGHIDVRDRLGDDVPDALVMVIERCLTHEPSGRPASAIEVESALAPLVEPEPVPEPEPVVEAVVEPVVEPTPPAPGLDLVGQVIGSYRVTGLLGSGGHSSVWLAQHPVIGTKVAIKVLRPEIAVIEGIVDRFTNEARATSMISSPHIARYLDLGALPTGQPYAILEYLNGETLQQRLESGKPLKLSTAVAIIRQSASALAEAHQLGIIHRDIKPGNIFVCEVETGVTGVMAKVIDFGVAKLTGPSAGEDTGCSQHGAFVGTTLYCAPEQITGDDLTTAADVYALGATLFELLTGRPPFTGDDIATTKTTSLAPAIEDGPIHVSALVAEMLSLSAADRPTMAEVIDRLAVTSASAPVVSAAAAAAESPFDRLGRRFQPKKSLVPWIAAGIGMAALVIFVLWSFSGSPDTTPRRRAQAAETAPAIKPDQRADDALIELDPKAEAAKIAPTVAPTVEPKTEAKTEAKTETKTEAKTETKVEPTVDDGPDPKVVAKADPSVDVKADAKPKHAKSDPPKAKAADAKKPPKHTEPPKAKAPDVIIADPFKTN
jgi:serine/threonine protein kinase